MHRIAVIVFALVSAQPVASERLVARAQAHEAHICALVAQKEGIGTPMVPGWHQPEPTARPYFVCLESEPPYRLFRPDVFPVCNTRDVSRCAAVGDP